MSGIGLYLLIVLALAVVVLTVRSLGGEAPWRVAVLVVLRLAAFASLLVAVVGLPRIVTRESTVPGELIVAVDDSQSMSLPVAAGKESRLDTARRVLAGLMGLSGGPGAPRLTTVAVGDGPVDAVPASGLQAKAERTDLRATLRELAVRHAPGEMVLVSDGADTRGVRAGELAGLVAGSGLKLTVVTVGEPHTPRDMSVGLLSAPRVVREGSRFELQATVRATGYGQTRIAGEMLRDGEKVRDVAAVARSGTAALKVRLTAGAPGRYWYTLRLPARDDEVTSANNSRSVLVRVVPDKPEVLLIGGAPSMEYAATKRVILGDESLRSRVYVRKTAPAGFWRDDGAPRQSSAAALRELGKTTAVILQDVPAAAVGSLAGPLRDFVRSGGGLLTTVGEQAAGGYPDSALADVLPGSVGAYVDELTGVQPAGGSGPLSEAIAQAGIPLSSLPTIRGRALVTPRQGAQVVLRAGGAPLLVAWQSGRGRVALLATDGLYRWAFSPRGGAEGERALATLWGAMLDWLTEVRDDRPVVAEFEREQYPVGTPARLIVQVTDESFQPVSGAQVVARLQPGGTRYPCTPLGDGRYEATIATPEPGALRVAVTASAGARRIGADEAATDVISAAAELLHSRPRPELLRRVAEASEGRSLRPEAVPAAAQSLAPAPRTVRRSTTVDRSRGAAMLVLVVLIWALDWSLRRRWYGG